MNESFNTFGYENQIVLFSVLRATSTYNQAKLIAKLVESKGYEVSYRDVISYNDLNNPFVHSALWFSLATATHLTHAVPAILMSKKPTAVYVTIEGLPKKGTSLYSNMDKLKYVAVSKFVAKMLTKIGFRVIDVVYHAVDNDLCDKAIRNSHVVRNTLNERFGERVKLLYVGRNDPRKALTKLKVALDMIDEKTKRDFVVLIKSERSARKIFENNDNVVFIDEFGNRSMLDVLTLMSACDYLVFPSVSEGFGLPVLEANAVGTPVIHCWFEPLSEFSSKEFNFVFDFDEITLVECKLSQYWVFHDYNCEYLAEMIKYAVEVCKSSKSEYDEYASKAIEHARKFDYRNVYPRLIRHLNID